VREIIARAAAGRFRELLLAASLLSITGCGPSGEPIRPDVLLITVDTLRADQVGAYGGGSLATPGIDAIAGTGVVFDRAIAAASRTVPAHASIMTSRNTRGHSVGFGNGETTLRGAPTLAEEFARAGYRTGGFVGNILLTRRTGIGTGFETYDDALDTPEINRPDVVERLAGATTDRAIEWLRVDDARPAFLWVHYQDPHGPYTPPEEDLTSFRAPPPAGEIELPLGDGNQDRGAIPPYQALPDIRHPSEYVARYAAEIHYADREIERLVAAAEERAGVRPLVLLITADHGESLGEAGHYFMHTHATTPDVAHVPLIIRAPGLAPARFATTVGHVDVMPTLLELAQIEIPSGIEGHALGPVARGEEDLPERFVYCDIGTQLGAYDEDGFVFATGLASPWRIPGKRDARMDRIRGERFRWVPGGPWRAEDSGPVALPPEIARYVGEAVEMAPIAKPDVDLQEQLRALGYADDPS
jgi:choline-sulfatase